MLLQFHRAVGGEKVAEALKDSLSDKLDAKNAGGVQGQTFGVISNGVNKGTKLYFGCAAVAWASPSILSKPKQKAPTTVCDALLKTYYGKAPVSAQAKEGMAHGFAALAAAARRVWVTHFISTRVSRDRLEQQGREAASGSAAAPARKKTRRRRSRRLGRDRAPRARQDIRRRARVDGGHLGRAPAVGRPGTRSARRSSARRWSVRSAWPGRRGRRRTNASKSLSSAAFSRFFDCLRGRFFGGSFAGGSPAAVGGPNKGALLRLFVEPDFDARLRPRAPSGSLSASSVLGR